MGWVAWLGIVLSLLKQLPKMLEQAEKLFDDVPDSGEQKKAFVMELVKLAAGVLTDVTGPEWDKLWVKIESAISSAIDILCLFFFPHDEEEEVA
jgi:hypothetical protein